MLAIQSDLGLKTKHMKTLIIHPFDTSTDFLLPIHDQFADKTVIRNGVTKNEILSMTDHHETFVAMGHGTPSGLMSVGQFPGSPFLIVDMDYVDLLKTKQHNIFIWCFAYEFAKRYNIPCVATNMFISELKEAFLLGLRTVSQSQIEESNICFVREISKLIHLPSAELFDSLKKGEYANLSQKNPVADYNFERLHLIEQY